MKPGRQRTGAAPAGAAFFVRALGAFDRACEAGSKRVLCGEITLKDAAMTRKLISSGSAFEARIGYSRAVVESGWIFVAGTTGYDYAKMEMPESVADQCRNALATIEKALAEAGATMADVVRVRYLLPHGDDFEPCWPVLQEVFGAVRPAATMMIVKLMTPEMKIEIEVTAKQP